MPDVPDDRSVNVLSAGMNGEEQNAHRSNGKKIRKCSPFPDFLIVPCDA